MAMTKEQRAEYMKRYREEHKEAISLSRKRYYFRNNERELSYQKVYYDTHREQINACMRDYYQKHKNDAEFKEKQKEAHKNWMKNNRDKWNAYCRQYRKRKALERQI